MKTQLVDLLTVENDAETAGFSQITQQLGEKEINILGFTGYGQNGKEVTSLYVQNPEKAREVLKQNKLNVRKEQAVLVSASNKPGMAGKITAPLKQKKLTLQRTFPYAEESGKPGGLVLQTSDPQATKELLDNLSEQPATSQKK